MCTFDIECVSENPNTFPSPETSPVITISAIVSDPTEDAERFVFTLRSCSPLPGTHVFSFDDERALLVAFHDFVTVYDFDLLSGYNILNFDLYYLFQRGKQLRVLEMTALGRNLAEDSSAKRTKITTKQTGTFDTTSVTISGRISFDVFDIVRREFSLKSYRLNAVAFHFLNDQKEDVHYSQMLELFTSGELGRKRIAHYCLRDSELTLRLTQKLSLYVNALQMSRVTSVPLELLLVRGQQLKVTMQLMRTLQKDGLFMPLTPRDGEPSTDSYEGAIVLEPQRGFYPNPVVVLDFASLYPSIMIAYNLCYSTLVTDPEVLAALAPEDYYKAPNDAYYVKEHVRAGVLPSVVKNLLQQRKSVKRAMNDATDPFLQMLLNGKQLALKVCANSVYGYTGIANVGHLPCLTISSSITAFGRELINRSKEYVETRISPSSEYAFGTRVIYGDTDSLMIEVELRSIAAAIAAGKKMAHDINSQFKKPLELEFEKVFCPYLLINKKRYAGLMWTAPDSFTKVETKGLETVRRDFCPFVLNFVRSQIAALLNQQVDISKLIVSKSLAKPDYKSPLPQVIVAQKMAERDAQNAPGLGDRVYYVIVSGDKHSSQGQNAEDPLFVLQNGLEIDTLHYLESLRKPIC
uniref:DNA polymerase n=1 Tax=Dermatophagoides pteronyssinus TaxID=6956 RepID=A0A6P6Y8K3_DERPT